MQEPHDLNLPELRDRAVLAARGRAPFDLLIAGGTIVDVATGELRPADIGLVGPLVASVHPRGTRDDAGQHLDVTGRFVAPGLIDTHLHIESSMVTPRRYAETVVPQGTTTICWDPHELGNVLGLDGVRWAIKAARDLPLRILVLAPSCVPSAPGLERAGAVFEAPEMFRMLDWDEVLGVAEVMDMRGVLERQPHMTRIVAAGLDSGKLVCGHARDLTGADLQAFAAAGIESDHEVGSGEDLLEKLRAGFTVELRGSHDHVLPGAVAALGRLPVLPATLTLCTDDIFPDDLLDSGGMIDLVRRLVRYGMRATDALRAATLNAAIRIGRRDLGLVAPGRRADLVVLSDLESLRVNEVLVSGRVAARANRLVAPIDRDDEPLPPDTIHLAPMTKSDFTLRVAHASTARLRTVVTPRQTRWGEIEVPVHEAVVELPEDAPDHGGGPPARPRASLAGARRAAGLGALDRGARHHRDARLAQPRGVRAGPRGHGGRRQRAHHGGRRHGGRLRRGRAARRARTAGLRPDLRRPPPPRSPPLFRKLRDAADAVADWQPPLRSFKSVVGASLACNPGPHVTDLGIADGSTGEVFPTVIAGG